MTEHPRAPQAPKAEMTEHLWIPRISKSDLTEYARAPRATRLKCLSTRELPKYKQLKWLNTSESQCPSTLALRSYCRYRCFYILAPFSCGDRTSAKPVTNLCICVCSFNFCFSTQSLIHTTSAGFRLTQTSTMVDVNRYINSRAYFNTLRLDLLLVRALAENACYTLIYRSMLILSRLPVRALSPEVLTSILRCCRGRN